MTAETRKPTTEVKASAREVHVSPRKARLVAKLVTSLPVSEALLQLEFLQKKAALPIKKLVSSAVANAAHNFQVEAERLFVKSLTVDGGRVFVRYEPRAQGRASAIRKRTSHLNLVLGVSAKALPGRKLKPKAEKPVSSESEAAAQPKAAGPETPAPEAPRNFRSRLASLWRRGKKPKEPSQVPPKQDPKGKRYTSFDRRGNM